MARHHYETLQQVFDDAYRGLAAQGFIKSVDGYAGCQYRGPEGRRCAIGHCIPDDRYQTRFDDGVSLRNVMLRSGVFGDINYENARDLQIVHDKSVSPQDMQVKLTKFAERNGLTIPSIEGAA